MEIVPTDPEKQWSSAENDSNYVISVRNAFKSFNVGRANEVLLFQNLNLTVQQGTIYGLLGPSGCGKTTMMKCIMSRVKLDAGQLLVYGAIPGTKKSGIPGKHVGYMPQEPSLFDTMTIGETLQFYGAVAGLTKSYIKERTKYFLKYLNMPPMETLNSKLSGGQLRRLSFIVALISKPRLIVLDEPTVGVDPIVRGKMWKYLEDVVALESTTIILTTHYIEEARNVNTVGMMRGGRLLVEASPKDLKAKYACETLEDVFLNACLNEPGCSPDNLVNNRCHFSEDLIEKERQLYADANFDQNVYSKRTLVARALGDNFFDHVRVPQPRRLWAVAKKNWIGFIRFPGSLLFICGLPGFILMLGCVAFKYVLDNTTIAIVNDDLGPWGVEYLKHINPQYEKAYFTSFSEGYEAVQNGGVLGLLHISKNFSYSMNQKAEGGLLSNDAFSKENDNIISVNLDGSQMTGKLLGLDLSYSFYNYSSLMFTNMGYRTSVFFAPVSIDAKSRDWLQQPTRVFLIPPLIILLPFMIQIAASILSLLSDKHKGYLERCFASGITAVETLSGLFFVQFGVIIVQCAVLLLIIFVGFGIPMEGSVLLLFVLVFGSAVVGTAQGVFWSIAYKDITTVFVYAYCFVFISIVFGGVFFPIEAAPAWFRVLQRLLPFEYPAAAAYNIMYRGWTLANTDVTISFVIQGAWILINFALALIAFKFI